MANVNVLVYGPTLYLALKGVTRRRDMSEKLWGKLGFQMILWITPFSLYLLLFGAIDNLQNTYASYQAQCSNIKPYSS